MTLDEAIQEALDLKEAIEDLKTRKTAAEKRFSELTYRTIPDLMQAAGHVKPDGSGSVTHVSGAMVYLRHDVQAYVLAADKPAFFEWLRANGAGEMIKEDVHSGTLKSWAKDRLENSAEIPDLVKVTPATVAILKKPKGTEL